MHDTTVKRVEPHAYRYPLILLLPGGALRKETEKFTPFYRRNYWKTIILPSSDEVLSMVQFYYGPLDFDLSE